LVEYLDVEAQTDFEDRKEQGENVSKHIFNSVEIARHGVYEAEQAEAERRK
jgi:hypothetical protein